MNSKVIVLHLFAYYYKNDIKFHKDKKITNFSLNLVSLLYLGLVFFCCHAKSL